MYLDYCKYIIIFNIIIYWRLIQRASHEHYIIIIIIFINDVRQLSGKISLALFEIPFRAPLRDI